MNSLVFHKIDKNIAKKVNNMLIVNQTETKKLTQEAVQDLHCVNTGSMQSDKGESVTDSNYVHEPSRQRRRSSSDGQVDKYDLDLRFRPRHKDKIVAAQNCVTFQNWEDQNSEKFGFIPLGYLMLPSIDFKNVTKENIYDVHRRIKVSGTFNFMKLPIQISS